MLAHVFVCYTHFYLRLSRLDAPQTNAWQTPIPHEKLKKDSYDILNSETLHEYHSLTLAVMLHLKFLDVYPTLLIP